VQTATDKAATKGTSSFGRVTVNLKAGTGSRIKAGDIAKAVLLGGVVASTADNSTANPRPVVLELIEGNNLPSWFNNKSKKCRLIGAAHGSISDERIYIRLETLACSNRQTGAVIEKTVSGYVSGDDGRVGVRGSVVIRDRELMLNSLLGGVLGGAASSLGALSSAQSSYNPFTGNVNQNQSTTDVLKQAGSEGVSNALDRYAQYYIERARNLEPVIQIAAGRQVDVIFTKGVSLSGRDNTKVNQPTKSPSKTTKPYQPQTAAGKDGFNQAEDFIKGMN
jgi:conjugal transfer pilus assembly protein TraB